MCTHLSHRSCEWRNLAPFFGYHENIPRTSNQEHQQGNRSSNTFVQLWTQLHQAKQIIVASEEEEKKEASRQQSCPYDVDSFPGRMDANNYTCLMMQSGKKTKKEKKQEKKKAGPADIKDNSI